jgi:hypothetical protein
MPGGAATHQNQQNPPPQSPFQRQNAGQNQFQHQPQPPQQVGFQHGGGGFQHQQQQQPQQHHQPQQNQHQPQQPQQPQQQPQHLKAMVQSFAAEPDPFITSGMNAEHSFRVNASGAVDSDGFLIETPSLLNEEQSVYVLELAYPRTARQ